MPRLQGTRETQLADLRGNLVASFSQAVAQLFILSFPGFTTCTPTSDES